MKRVEISRPLWKALRAERQATLLSISAIIVSVGALYLLAGWTGAFLASLASNAPMAEVVRSTLFGVALLAIVTASSAVRDVSLVSIAAALSASVRMRMLHSLVRQPAAIGRARPAGESMTRLAGDISLLHQSLVRVLAVWLPSVVTSAVLLIALVVSSFPLALATVCLVTPALLFVGRSGRRLQGAVRLTQESASALGHAIAESLAGVREAKVFRREQALEERFAVLSREGILHAVREERAAVAHPALTTFASALALTTLVLVAAWWRRTGTIDGDDVTRFLVLLALLVGPLQEAIRSSSAVARARALLARCDEIIDGPIEHDAQGSQPLVPSAGGCSLSFESVEVRHSSRGFALGPLSLDVRRGETIVITGASGSGKSTLLELVPRLGDLTSGTLRIDGRDIRTLTIASVRGACAFVPQEPYFFAGTIRDNLTFAQGDVAESDLARACRSANADTMVRQLPLGLDTPLSSAGANLSVGERQRLALARAMIVNPSILLLDEPTAALDHESERLVVDSLRELTEGRTAIIVTHSRALHALAHRVVMMANGGIVSVEQGARSTARRASQGRFALTQ